MDPGEKEKSIICTVIKLLLWNTLRLTELGSTASHPFLKVWRRDKHIGGRDRVIS